MYFTSPSFSIFLVNFTDVPSCKNASFLSLVYFERVFGFFELHFKI